jgi:hypothetical protein
MDCILVAKPSAMSAKFQPRGICDLDKNDARDPARIMRDEGPSTGSCVVPVRERCSGYTVPEADMALGGRAPPLRIEGSRELLGGL